LFIRYIYGELHERSFLFLVYQKKFKIGDEDFKRLEI